MSFVLAFGLSIASFFCCGLFAVLPLIFAIVAVVQASGGNHEGARTMAKVSTIIGGVMMVLGVIFLVAYVALTVVGGASGGY